MPFSLRIKFLGEAMKEQIFRSIDCFVESTRDVLYLREDDLLLIIRPNRIQHVNRTAFDILNSLYTKRMKAEKVTDTVSEKYGIKQETVIRDMSETVNTINALLTEDYKSATIATVVDFDPSKIKYPILSEIALTYRCQNRCEFCYASSPYRGKEMKEMSTGEVFTVIDRICDEAKVPTISFTGGEPTLRDDLPVLVEYASKKGMRTNLITNGIRCSDSELVKKLAGAGLNSAQVSLESHDPEIHNRITGNSKAHSRVVSAIHNLKKAGIHTHTNTTICMGNREHLMPLVKFVKDEYDAPYLSMNMIIATGIAKDNENINIGYTVIGEIIKPVIRYCEEIGIKFVWYSPTPYCIFNPVEHNLGSKSCACVSGLLSVNPAGDIIPCSSYNRGIGNLLKHPFSRIWNSDQALYFRERRYLPPVCRNCDMEKLCSGACPLYWENAGNFREIEEANKNRPVIKNLLWSIENRLRLKTRGVDGIRG